MSLTPLDTVSLFCLSPHHHLAQTVVCTSVICPHTMWASWEEELVFLSTAVFQTLIQSLACSNSMLYLLD